MARPITIDQPISRPRRQRTVVLDQVPAILASAGALFLAKGYSGVSIDALIEATGGSKRDLYSVFGSKEALFKQVVATLCRDRIATLRLALTDDGNPVSALRSASETALRLVLENETLALHRLLVAEGSRLPEIAVQFLEQGPAAAYGVFAEILRKCDQRDRREEDYDALGQLFIDSLTGELQLRALLGEIITEDEILRKVQIATTVFLAVLKPVD
ncbi:TetR/AcrR family transcriptional regulator [Sphingobium boeckii]|uniref:AcrR family transcriptional regulator n=1 Tax=Sphingobium boeckii TaxID=1082345 RepID=A0A7W9EED1_9SPHN|nr:TetR/AcrR family transcriptional regulator [Sphingobium boeckii]MBB5684875.1 AcrR family transcriptional regulator [Sphingobium boeckii]